MSYIVQGTCSLCGGQVVVPAVWMSAVPPTPTCLGCGAVAASHGPVIPMQRPTQPTAPTEKTNNTQYVFEIDRIRPLTHNRFEAFGRIIEGGP